MKQTKSWSHTVYPSPLVRFPGGQYNSENSECLDHPLMRRRVYSEVIQLSCSPLHDISYIAQPGLHTRVTRAHTTVRDSSKMRSYVSTGHLDELDEPMEVQGGYTMILVWAAAIAVLPALQYGLNNANMNTPAQAMRDSLGIPDAGPNAAAAAVAWGFCISVFCLGALAGCTIVAACADKTGRRATLKIISATFVAGSLLEAASGYFHHVWLMIFGRALSGAASGATTVAVPLYLGEIAPAHLRGALGTCFQLSAVVAMLVAQVLGLPSLMGNARMWTWYMLLVIVPALVMWCFKERLVKSPVWLACRNTLESRDQAREILARLRGEELKSESISLELSMMRRTVGANEGFGSGDRFSAALVKDPVLRRGLGICIVCSMVQQFSGINNVFNYSTTFLAANGLDPTTVTVIAVAMNVGNVIISVVSGALMDRLGRKALLLLSSSGMLVSIIALSAALDGTVPEHAVPCCSIVAVVGFVMSFGMGLGPIPWLLPAELMTTNRCAQGSAIAAGINWLANFVVGQTFPTVSAALGAHCFLPFAGVLGLFIVFVCRYVPETRGKTLDEIMFEIAA